MTKEKRIITRDTGLTKSLREQGELKKLSSGTFGVSVFWGQAVNKTQRRVREQAELVGSNIAIVREENYNGSKFHSALVDFYEFSGDVDALESRSDGKPIESLDLCPEENFRFLTRNITYRHSANDIYHLSAGEEGSVKEGDSPNHYRVNFEGVPVEIRVRKLHMGRTKSEKIIVPYDASVESIHSAESEPRSY